jgi:hypothetical protein
MTENAKRKAPTGGGRKGGTYFPKIDLKKAVEYNKKLVSKTHTAPQPASIILPGVFNNNGPDGTVRASALRQFGLLNEDKLKMGALELGKNIASSPAEELQPLLQKACLSPKLFKQLYETFKGDTVNTAKLKQQAIKLKVHPDSAESCIQIFVSSLQYSGLAQAQGDNFILSNDIVAKPQTDDVENADIDDSDIGEEQEIENDQETTDKKRQN